MVLIVRALPIPAASQNGPTGYPRPLTAHFHIPVVAMTLAVDDELETDGEPTG